MSIVIVCIIFAVIFLSVLWFEPFKWQRKRMGELGAADYKRFINKHIQGGHHD